MAKFNVELTGYMTIHCVIEAADEHDAWEKADHIWFKIKDADIRRLATEEEQATFSAGVVVDEYPWWEIYEYEIEEVSEADEDDDDADE